MFPILKKRRLNDSMTLMVVRAPLIARKAHAGQFIILRVNEQGERIPLTIADYDREQGTVTIIYQIVGKTTLLLDQLNEGDSILDFVGPLGKPSHLEGYQNAAVIGGGAGCAIAYPQAKTLHARGAKVDIIAGFRTKDLIILEDEMRAASDRLFLMTDDGSNGHKGFVTDALKNGGATDITCSAAADSYKKVYDDVKQSMGKNEGRIFVALDGDSLEAAGTAKKDLLKSGEASNESIYGVGRTDANVAMLGDGIIQAIGAEDEYSMGYLGIKIAIDGIQKKYNENDITVNFIVSDKSNMHYPKNRINMGLMNAGKIDRIHPCR